MLYVSDCSRGASVCDVKLIPGSGFIKWMRPLWFYKAEKQGQVQESTIEIWPGELMVLLEEKVSIKVGQQMEAPTCPGGCCVQFGSNTADQRPPTAANDLDPRPSQTADCRLIFRHSVCLLPDCRSSISIWEAVFTFIWYSPVCFSSRGVWYQDCDSWSWFPEDICGWRLFDAVTPASISSLWRSPKYWFSHSGLRWLQLPVLLYLFNMLPCSLQRAPSGCSSDLLWLRRSPWWCTELHQETQF